ncbi:hypothetical protein [Kibdelosporangium aridum]|uniref:hypothetical protein n=1 Tax=Kibdelosporangium aridum TaxID=2030 RepID=UPI0006921D8A|nr:hypothetical protein [Kibdelosporangium aridum]
MLAVVVGVLAGLLAVSGQASAVEDQYIGKLGFEQRCADTGHLMCLYRLGNGKGAYWGTSKDVRNLEGIFYRTVGTGQNQPVKNNSESVMCALPVYKCYIYFNSGYLGNWDWLYGGEVGNLLLTWSDNASVRIRHEL